MSPDDLRNLLARVRQEHLLSFWNELSPQGRAKLRREIDSLDLDLVASLVSKIEAPHSSAPPRDLRAPDTIPIPLSERDRSLAEEARQTGLRALAQGECAFLLVAGGQATRLGYDAPKGTFPIGPVTDRTLFQFHAEKILALSRRLDVPLRWLIMTSSTNASATLRFFEEHRFFSLDPACVTFFAQGELPALDSRGKILLAEKDSLALSPNGHGGCLAALRDSGALADLVRAGARYLFYFQVDNPLVPIPDPVFLGFHLARRADMSLKVVEKTDPAEKVGLVVAADRGCRVIEYSDLPPDLARKRDPDGRLTLRAGSIGIHLLSLDFVERVLEDDSALPYHVAHKKVPCVDSGGKPVEPDAPNAYKFEKFIFDALTVAERTVIMEVLREREFAPVKNASGADSPDTARALLEEEWRRWLTGAGLAKHARALKKPIEISPLYALDETDFVRKTAALPDGPSLLFEPALSERR
ncbi:MAG: UDPGP type 1 family protein [Planctomycetota bacterium]